MTRLRHSETFFCAICTAEIRASDVRMAPLGKGGAMVRVCAECEDEPAREKRGPDRAYTSDRERMTKDVMQRKVHDIAKDAYAGSSRPLTGCASSKTPGWILVRVKSGPGIDVRDAARGLRKSPFFSHLRYIGVAGGYHLFERPDPMERFLMPSKHPLASDLIKT